MASWHSVLRLSIDRAFPIRIALPREGLHSLVGAGRALLNRGGEPQVGERPAGVVEGSYGAVDYEVRYQEEQAADDAYHEAGGDVVRAEQQHGWSDEDEA